jgi:hypothetical protein
MIDLTQLIDADKVGGWVRAWVAAGLAAVLANMPGLHDVLTADVQTALGVVASGIAIGAWSHFAKYLKDKK